MANLDSLFLLVDDCENDVLFLQNAFSKCHLLNPLQVVTNGAEAMAYLEGAGLYRNRDKFPFPAVVFLDLKMPGISGFEVLKWIREKPAPLGSLRVVNVLFTRNFFAR